MNTMKNEKIRKEINLMTNDLNDALIRTFEHVDILHTIKE